MKVLFLHRWVGVHPGGTETHIKNLMDFFVARGHEVYLITRAGGSVAEFNKKIKVFTVTRLPYESDFSYKSMIDPRLYLYTFLFMVLVFVKFLEIYFLKNERFDILSIHFVTEAKVARLIRFFFHIPFAFSLEGYTTLEAREARHADLIFSVSRDIADRCQKNFGYTPIVKTHGVDLKVFNENNDGRGIRQKYNLDDSFVFLTVCRLEPRKDLPTLLRAARKFLDEHDAVFLIVGEGIQGEELKLLAKELGLDGRVIFSGQVSNEELPNYYAAGNVFVLPTLYEGFGIVYAEAMASGLPIISTSTSAVPEVVGDAGLLFPPRDVAALVNALTQMSTDHALYLRLKDKALRRAKDNFDLEKRLAIYENSCETLINNRRGKAAS